MSPGTKYQHKSPALLQRIYDLSRPSKYSANDLWFFSEASFGNLATDSRYSPRIRPGDYNKLGAVHANLRLYIFKQRLSHAQIFIFWIFWKHCFSISLSLATSLFDHRLECWDFLHFFDIFSCKTPLFIIPLTTIHFVKKIGTPTRTLQRSQSFYILDQ